jgi:hypothetical protein
MPAPPASEQVELFESIISIDKKYTVKEVEAATASCFLVGRPSSDYQKLFSRAAERRREKNGLTSYIFYAGGKMGNKEGDIEIEVVVGGDPEVIRGIGVGRLIS